MRILHVISSLAIGGSEQQLLELIRHASDPGAHHVAVFDEAGARARGLPNETVWAGPLGRGYHAAGRLPLVANRIRRAIRELHVQLVHAHHDLGEVVAAAATPRRVPLVAERQGVGSAWLRRGALRPLLELAHRRTDLLICNARYLKDHATRHERSVPPSRVVYPGVDVERFAPVPQPPWDPPTVAVIANLHPIKRHDRFLRAFACVSERVPAARAIIVGGGPQETSLRALTSELGLERSVEFVGLLDDPRTAVARAHLVCLTSQSEGFPNALLEGMCMGRPVVATRVGGVPELVRNGIDGFVTDPSVEGIAEALQRLLGDRELTADMGARAAERAREFRLPLMVEGIEAVYRMASR